MQLALGIAILLVVLATCVAVLVSEKRRPILVCIGIAISIATGVIIWIGAWGLTIDRDNNWLSPQETIQLALLAAALAAFVTWIYKDPKSGEAQTSESLNSANAQHHRVILIGRLWILSALFLTVLAMLIPLVNEIRVHPSLEPWWLNPVIQSGAILALLLGTSFLTFGTLWGIYEILSLLASDMRPHQARPRQRKSSDIGWLLTFLSLWVVISLVIQRPSVQWIIGGAISAVVILFAGLYLVIRRSNRKR